MGIQGHKCENRLYLLDGAKQAYGYYEILLESPYRALRVRKSIGFWMTLTVLFQGHESENRA